MPAQRCPVSYAPAGLGRAMQTSVEWVELDEACRVLGIGAVLLLHLVEAGEIEADGMDGRVVFSRESLNRVAAQPPSPKPGTPRKRRRPTKPDGSWDGPSCWASSSRRQSGASPARARCAGR